MKLSIITINYNNKDGLRKTIDSVIGQTWRDFEWIIIDGGSTDGSKELIEKNQEHFSYWCSEPDKGIYHAMNKGIAMAQGDYLNFMNSGDCYYEPCTLENVFFISKSEIDIFYGDAYRISSMNKYIFTYPQKLTLHYILKDGLCHQATFIRTSLLKDNGYREDLKLISDWHKFIELFRQGKSFLHTGTIVVKYDLSGISSNSHDMLTKERRIIFDDLFGKENRTLIAESIALERFYEMYNCDDMQRAFRIKEYGGKKIKWMFHWMLRLLNKTF